MPKWIDHIVVRVNDVKKRQEDYENKLGMKASKGPDAIPDLGMTRAILPLGDQGRVIELAEPLGEGGAIGNALERYGEGVHLVALAVDDEVVEGGLVAVIVPSEPSDAVVGMSQSNVAHNIQLISQSKHYRVLNVPALPF